LRNVYQSQERSTNSAVCTPPFTHTTAHRNKFHASILANPDRKSGKCMYSSGLMTLALIIPFTRSAKFMVAQLVRPRYGCPTVLSTFPIIHARSILSGTFAATPHVGCICWMRFRGCASSALCTRRRIVAADRLGGGLGRERLENSGPLSRRA
jgi:hypothetical protein